MRFGVAESDSESDYDVVLDVLDDGCSSDESDHVPDLTKRRMSKLGESIRDMLQSSDESEVDSEDEVGDLLDGSYAVLQWREPKKETAKPKASKPIARPMPRRQSTLPPPRAGPSWKRGWEPTVSELLREQPSAYTDWVKSTETEAWYEGHRVAGERAARFRANEAQARQEMLAASTAKRDSEADEIERMMAGLAVKQGKEDEERQKSFEEREAALWADIDAAIKDAERREADKQARAAADARKRKEEEEARIAAEEKAALARKAEADRLAREKTEKEAADKAASEAAAAAKAKAEEDAKAAEDKQRAVAAEGSRGTTEWAHWVGVQKQMRSGVIDVIKANPDLRKPLRPGMRLITRGLGQVVNTKSSIVRITADINDILCGQLPSPPSAASPVMLEHLTPSYGYLLSHTAKALIKQAENEVSAKPDAAFPLARIVLGLIFRGHGALAPILFARLVKKNPWVIPHYPARGTLPREEYEKATGRKADESVAEYIARMGGICTLYFAVLAAPYRSIVGTIASPPTPQQLAALIPAPLRLPAAWTWLASITRGGLPAAEPSAHLISVLLDTAGADLLAVLGPRQVGKVLVAIMGGLEAGKIPGDSEAARARLRLLLEGWGRDGRLKAPVGREWEE